MTMLSALVEQIGPLEAAEAMRGAQVVAVGTGSMKQADLDSVLGSWKRAAGGEARRPQKNLAEHLAVADALGIEVVRG